MAGKYRLKIDPSEVKKPRVRQEGPNTKVMQDKKKKAERDRSKAKSDLRRGEY